MGDWGGKVVRQGHSVESASILDQVFNTSFNTMKTSLRGTGVSTASGIRFIALAGPMSYKPGFMAWFKVGSGKWYAVGMTEDVNGCDVECYVNSSNYLIAKINSPGSQTVTVKYVLLVDPGE